VSISKTTTLVVNVVNGLTELEGVKKSTFVKLTQTRLTLLPFLHLIKKNYFPSMSEFRSADKNKLFLTDASFMLNRIILVRFYCADRYFWFVINILFMIDTCSCYWVVIDLWIVLMWLSRMKNLAFGIAILQWLVLGFNHINTNEMCFWMNELVNKGFTDCWTPHVCKLLQTQCSHYTWWAVKSLSPFKPF